MPRMTKRSRPTALAVELRAALEAAAEPARAPAMQAYMKSSMPYYGVSAPRAKLVFREVFGRYPFVDAARWQGDVLELWRGARHREERYGAMALAGHKRAAPFRTTDVLPMFEEMIVTGAWWDFVDEIAAHRVGELLARDPATMKPRMRAWSRSDDLWKRRTSILCQLRHGPATDLELLYACIAPSIASTEFFLRKAIGWALRQVAWFDPDEVVRYVDAHAGELSGLSKREALKNVPALASGARKLRAGRLAKPERAPSS